MRGESRIHRITSTIIFSDQETLSGMPRDSDPTTLFGRKRRLAIVLHPDRFPAGCRIGGSPFASTKERKRASGLGYLDPNARIGGFSLDHKGNPLSWPRRNQPRPYGALAEPIDSNTNARPCDRVKDLTGANNPYA